jgi:hypothetical protein
MGNRAKQRRFLVEARRRVVRNKTPGRVADKAKVKQMSIDYSARMVKRQNRKFPAKFF